MKEKPAIVRHVWDAILDDTWIWVAAWGPQRCGKTTLAMQIAYEVYGDWDKVLQSFVFNLSGLLYKLDKGEPERIWTVNKLHNRVPFVIYDDFGASSNKATTQYDMAWDIFKGGFDVLGTELAVLMATMVDPTEPTYQIHQKYTHELFIPRRGVYKYDKVIWDQDYKGWKPKKRKEWIETNEFCEVPEEVYKEYDEMRMSLVPELKQRIKDAMAQSQTEFIIKRLQPIDVELMEIIQQRGQISYDYLRDSLGDKYREAMIRCKARSLVIPIRKGSVYWYDITDLGLEILKINEEGVSDENSKPQKRQRVKLING